MNYAIENSFLPNNPIDASDFYFLICFLNIHGFSLRSSSPFRFFIERPCFLSKQWPQPIIGYLSGCLRVIECYIINKISLCLSRHQTLPLRFKSEGFGNRYSSPIDFHFPPATFADQLRPLPKADLFQYFFSPSSQLLLSNSWHFNKLNFLI